MRNNLNWPVSRKEIKKFTDDVIYQSFSFVKKNKYLKKDIDFILLNNGAIIKDIIDLYVAKKFLSTKYKNNYFTDNRLINEVRFNKKISFNDLINKILHGLKKKNFFFFSLSWIKKLLLDKLKYIRKEDIDPNKHIITFSNSELIIKQSFFLKKKKLKLSYFQDWIPVGKLDLNHIKVKKTKCFINYYNFIIKFFSKYNMKLSRKEKEFFIRVLEMWYRLTFFFENEINKNKTNLPKELWINAAGLFYNRIFAKLVRDNGGKVYGFAHGSPCIVNSKDQLLSEFNFVDTFYTYNKNIRDIALKMFDKKIIFNNFTKKNILYVK